MRIWIKLNDPRRDQEIEGGEMKKNSVPLHPHPIEAIKFRMDQQGFTQADMVRAGCGTRSHVCEIMNKRRKLNLRFIRAYNKKWDATPLWVLIQDYQLRIKNP